MNVEELEEVTQELIAAHFKKRREEIKLENRFIEDLGADSLDVIELIFTFEHRFGITITAKQASEVETVSDALYLVLVPALKN